MTGGIKVRALSYTAVRGNLGQTMQQVCDHHEPVVITRSHRGAVVMISLEDYEALNETAYLLRSPRNAQRLLESIRELESGTGTERDLIE
jgi:antitoxin YefM